MFEDSKAQQGQVTPRGTSKEVVETVPRFECKGHIFNYDTLMLPSRDW